MRLILTIALACSFAACATERRQVRELTAGSCEQTCADENPDSLYDENRCRESCS